VNHKEKRQEQLPSQQTTFTMDVVLGPAREDDHEWFRRHPGVRHYIRPYHRGDWNPDLPGVDWVFVEQAAPGIHLRTTLPKGLDPSLPSTWAILVPPEGADIIVGPTAV
jgi:hypothetical protein